MPVLDFFHAKSAGRRLSMVTCYDYTFAKLIGRTAVDAVLVGDSVAMAIHGHPNTLSATVDMMATHTAAVARGAAGKFLVADLPFLSFRKGLPAAMDAAQALMSAGAQAVKLEGILGHEDVVERLVQSGIPVMGHVGMQPQSVHAYGGFKPQGRTEGEAERIAGHAKRLEALGVFSIVLECIPAGLAASITKSLGVPTIGIGAGAGCDGQILVLQDLLGLNVDFRPRFARRFGSGDELTIGALQAYDRAVKDGTFPAETETYS